MINKSGDIIFNNFKRIGEYKNNWAKVQVEGKYGYLNIDGTIIQPIFDDLDDSFCDGFACFRIGGKFGIINTNGEIVFEDEDIDYKSCENSGNGTFIVRSKTSDNFGYIDVDKGIDLKPQFDEVEKFEGGAIFIKDNKYGLICSGENVVIMPKYDGLHRFGFIT